ncbi:MAG TPA: sigma-70 family RNA polymerase sigma factor [Ruminiclostridium sp.]|nr:sigma-70 family RNA polymerase sigma factor [Ruminiclostridium sp.]
MNTNDDISVENCRRLLRRAAWRIQYKARIQQSKERQMIFENQAYDSGFESDVLSKFYVKELLETIPWEKCRFILERTIINGLTEQEVAIELHMTQQGVNKWKKKGLALLRQTLMDL